MEHDRICVTESLSLSSYTQIDNGSSLLLAILCMLNVDDRDKDVHAADNVVLLPIAARMGGSGAFTFLYREK